MTVRALRVLAGLAMVLVLYSCGEVPGDEPASANGTDIRSTASYEPSSIVNDALVNIQIVNVESGAASGYFDVQPLTGDSTSIASTESILVALAQEMEEVLPFLTDAEVDTVTLRIIRITDLDEYNAGSGFEDVAEASLVLETDGWTLARLDAL